MRSLAGFALEIGDRLLINGEEVTFKGWVDQSLTAIEVKAIADDTSPVKQIRAKEIVSLARLQDSVRTTNASINDSDAEKSSSHNSEQTSDQPIGQTASNRDNSDRKSSNQSEDFEVSSEPKSEETPEANKEPEYNAWEVWTYLERQRVKTLKLLNTFQAEWEANRFVREAERSTPANLRVHYEIRPILLDESVIKESAQSEYASHSSKQSKTDRVEEEYADAIDVEIID
ncbi:MAG: hypothetical protein DCF19_01970 [Pseudanabaena frigida]|uniref:Uncharacterized protein n=1 Tax=Pseudanabaena frigida TaxID=945775 RepID=A0A2W4WMX4_9CYAN|nr:MAG: hypothetical protein DCF19_01970 [Pseudanabaena frigida]